MKCMLTILNQDKDTIAVFDRITVVGNTIVGDYHSYDGGFSILGVYETQEKANGAMERIARRLDNDGADSLIKIPTHSELYY